MPADSTDLELAISCSSVSCLINMEPLELLRLQPNEPIASESEGAKARNVLESCRADNLMKYLHAIWLFEVLR